MNQGRILAEVVFGWAAIAAFYDLWTGKIPNWLTFPPILLGLALNGALGGWHGFQKGFLGALTGVALLLIPFLLRKMGAGDVKMLAGIGALQGPGFALQTFIYAAFWGGLMGGAAILLRRRVVANNSESARRPRKDYFTPISRWATGETVPYGVAIFLGALVAQLMRC